MEGSWILFLVAVVAGARADVSYRGGGDPDRCNRTVDIYQAVTSPPLTEKNQGKPLHCSYKIRLRPARDDWVVFVRFTRLKVGEPSTNRSHCLGGYLQIVDGFKDYNQTNKDSPSFYCGEIDSPKTFISETPFVKIVFHVDRYDKDSFLQFDANVEQQQEVHARYGQYPHLYPHRRGVLVTGTYCERQFQDCTLGRCFVQSPGFPGIYPRNLHCKYRITVPQGLAGLDLTTFDVDGLRCDNLLKCFPRSVSKVPEDCPFDYVRVFDGLTDDSPVIVTLCGRGRLKSNVIASGPQMLVEFVTAAAGPLLNTGFHFKADNMLDATESEPLQLRNTGCSIERHLRASGQTTFSNLRSWYPGNTTCSYRFFAAEDEIIKLEFLWFRIERATLCQESLKLYDAFDADPAKIITKLCDMSKPRTEPPRNVYESTGPVLLVHFASLTGSLDGSSLSYGFEVKSLSLASSPVNPAEHLCNRVHPADDALSGSFAFPVHHFNVTNLVSHLLCNVSFDARSLVHGRVSLTLHSPFTKLTDKCGECRSSGSLYLELSLGGARPLSRCLCQMGESKVHTLASLGPTARLTLHVPAGSDVLKQVVQQQQQQQQTQPQTQSNKGLIHGTFSFFSEPRCGPERLELGLQGAFSFPFHGASSSSLAAPYLCGDQCSGTGPLFCVWRVPSYQGMDVAFRLEGDANCTADPILGVNGRSLCSPDGADLVVHHDDLLDSQVTIEFQTAELATVNFTLWWTLVSSLPSPADVLLSLDKDCEFLCASAMVCLKKELVCNGVPNCPAVAGKLRAAADEEKSLCAAQDQHFKVYWWIIGFGAGLCACVVLCIGVSVCRRYHAGRRRFK